MYVPLIALLARSPLASGIKLKIFFIGAVFVEEMKSNSYFLWWSDTTLVFHPPARSIGKMLSCQDSFII